MLIKEVKRYTDSDVEHAVWTVRLRPPAGKSVRRLQFQARPSRKKYHSSLFPVNLTHRSCSTSFLRSFQSDRGLSQSGETTG